MKKLVYILVVILLISQNKIIAQKNYNSIPLSEHPRPDFKRDNWKNLNGEWEFKFDQKNEGLKNEWYNGKTPFNEKIIVPFPWGSKLSGIEDKANIGWYKKSITVDSAWENKKTYIVIGASDWETSVWIDGVLLGKHKGGYVPFSFDITSHLKYGNQHQIIIRVDDNAGDPDKFKNGYALYGKQGYGNARGIWQTIYLEARGEDFLDAIHFTPDIDNSKVKVTGYLDDYANKEIPFSIKIKTGKKILKHNFFFKPGEIKNSFDIEIPEMRLWDLDDPFLYQVEAKLGDDLVHSYFGMRKISVMNLPGTEFPYVALNNKPIYLQIALDQSYHPDGFYTFPSDNFMKEEILRSKSIGLNGIRVHIKVEIPRKLYWADKLGLLVVEDLPNSWGEPDKFMRDESEYTLKEMIKRDYNHPSIFSWVLFNEQWGLKTKNKILPETYNWVTSMYYLAKSLDSTRLVEDNSLCCGGLHTATDINSWHVYLPGYEWENYLKEQTDKNYEGSTHLYYKGFKQGKQPFLNSESGNVWGYKGSTGDVDWSYDYHRMINSFRKFPEVAGWLYTEHHDVINEWNGYWKFDRSKKIDGLDKILDGMNLNDFHSPIYISTGVEICKSVEGGDEVDVPIYISSMTGKDYGDELYLEYELTHLNSFGQSKLILSKQLTFDYKPWINKNLNPIKIKLPEENGLSKLTLKLKTKNNVTLHKNFMHFDVNSLKEIKGIKTITVPANKISNSKWSKKSWEVLNGKKINGTGSGFFEYKIQIPYDLKISNLKEAYFIIEASAKQLFDKDKEGLDYVDAGMDWMKGSIVSPSKNPNSYPMTDENLFPSKINISFNDVNVKSVTLSDDPADHRGVLSWHNQIKSKNPTLSEAGSYGYLVKIPIDNQILIDSKKNGELKIKMFTNDDGGIAIYGKSFGRFPFDPSLVLISN